MTSTTPLKIKKYLSRAIFTTFFLYLGPFNLPFLKVLLEPKIDIQNLFIHGVSLRQKITFKSKKVTSTTPLKIKKYLLETISHNFFLLSLTLQSLSEDLVGAKNRHSKFSLTVWFKGRKWHFRVKSDFNDPP